jgi:hypothetical protein
MRAAKRGDAALGFHLAEPPVGGGDHDIAASIISMPMVKTMPCTVVTIGFRHRPFSANASTLPGVGSTISAFGPKNFVISSPAVRLPPSAQTTPTQ